MTVTLPVVERSRNDRRSIPAQCRMKYNLPLYLLWDLSRRLMISVSFAGGGSPAKDTGINCIKQQSFRLRASDWPVANVREKSREKITENIALLHTPARFILIPFTFALSGQSPYP